MHCMSDHGHACQQVYLQMCSHVCLGCSGVTWFVVVQGGGRGVVIEQELVEGTRGVGVGQSVVWGSQVTCRGSLASHQLLCQDCLCLCCLQSWNANQTKYMLL